MPYIQEVVAVATTISPWVSYVMSIPVLVFGWFLRRLYLKIERSISLADVKDMLEPIKKRQDDIKQELSKVSSSLDMLVNHIINKRY